MKVIFFNFDDFKKFHHEKSREDETKIKADEAKKLVMDPKVIFFILMITKSFHIRKLAKF